MYEHLLSSMYVVTLYIGIYILLLVNIWRENYFNIICWHIYTYMIRIITPYTMRIYLGYNLHTFLYVPTLKFIALILSQL